MSTAPPGTVYDGDMAATLVQEPSSRVLTQEHRCDRCHSQAFVSASHPDWEQDLLFCGHHGREHLPALLEIQGVWVHDETDKLLEAESN